MRKTSESPGSPWAWAGGHANVSTHDGDLKVYKYEHLANMILHTFCLRFVSSLSTEALFLIQLQAIYLLIKSSVLNIHIAAFSGHEENPPIFLFSKLRGEMVECRYPSCLLLVAVSYLNKSLSALSHAFERSINAIISGIHGVLRDIQAYRILAACKLN